MLIDRFTKQCFSFQGLINLRVLLRVINVAIMLFLITGKAITAQMGSDSIIIFDYKGVICCLLSVMDSTGFYLETKSMPCQHTQLAQLPSSELCH